MSLDKAIRSGKEHRKPYRGNKAVDPMCCNHGGCDYCRGLVLTPEGALTAGFGGPVLYRA